MHSKQFFVFLAAKIGFFVLVFQGARVVFAKTPPLVCNSGIALGLPLPSQVVLILSFIFILFLGWWGYGYYKEKNAASLGFLFFISGAVSNFLERILYGCVTDYIQLFSFFPSFNLADVGIALGLWISMWIYGLNRELKKI